MTDNKTVKNVAVVKFVTVQFEDDTIDVSPIPEGATEAQIGMVMNSMLKKHNVIKGDEQESSEEENQSHDPGAE